MRRVAGHVAHGYAAGAAGGDVNDVIARSENPHIFYIGACVEKSFVYYYLIDDNSVAIGGKRVQLGFGNLAEIFGASEFLESRKINVVFTHSACID